MFSRPLLVSDLHTLTLRLPQLKTEVKTEVKAESPRPPIPQLDGPSTTSSQEDESGSSDGSPSPPSKSVPLPSIKKTPPAAHVPSQQDDDDAIIGSDLDDSDDDDNGDQDDDEVEGGSKVLCTYDRVRYRFSEQDFPVITFLAPPGTACQKQVEMCAEGWHGPHQWQRLPLFEMHWVC